MLFSYTKEQIISISISFLIVIFITSFVYHFFKNKSDKIKRIPILIATILVIIAEFSKYFLLIKTKNYNELYPSFYCSFLWFWFLFADFTKGKFADSCEAISLTGSIAMMITLFAYPSSIIGHSAENLFSSYLNFHHLLFHFLVILHLFLCVALKQCKAKKEYFLYVFIWVLILCAVIIPRAYITGINYMDLLSSPVPIFENVRLAYGQIVYNIILIIWFTIALELIMLVCYMICNKFRIRNTNHKAMCYK